jgi:ribokinase
LLRARRAELLQLLPRLEVLFTNEAELAALLPGVALQAALAQLGSGGPSIVAVKLGAQGCVVAGSGRRLAAPAFTVDAIDTTGCGDAFAAGFLHARRRGLSLDTCAVLANALGALTATRRGSADALPNRASLSTFLHERAVAPAGLTLAADATPA